MVQTQPKKPTGLGGEGNKHKGVRSVNSFTALPRQSDRKHSLITTQMDPGPPPAANHFVLEAGLYRQKAFVQIP